jgi:aryl-alcohol dehydrogenase-like predicted oxidoreductase
VNVEEIKAAGKYFKVTTVQNLYNLGNRQSEEVLDYCDANNIGFIPWFPLAAGELAAEGSVLSKISAKLKASNGQVALAWLLKRSKVMLPIPGTGSVDHLIENVGGASIELSDEDFKALEHAAK